MAKIRYPLATPFMSRDGSLEVYDSYIQNAFIDKYQDKFYVMKRPGTSLLTSIGTNNAGQGLFYYNGFIYVVINDILYRTSGTQNAGTDGTAFTQITPIPWQGRVYFGSVVFKGVLYVIGGNVTSTNTGDIWSSPDGVNWASNTSAPPFGNRNGSGVVVFRNQIFVIGGLLQPGATYPQDVWSSPDGTNWTQVVTAAPWAGRISATFVVAQNGIYMMGGSNGVPTYFHDVWFSADGITWTQVTPAASWATRSGAVGVFFNNLIWIIGGSAGATVYNDVWSSPDGNVWTSVSAAAFSAGGTGGITSAAAVVYNNKMWVLGGENSLGTALTSVYSSATGSGSWTLVTNSPGWGARFGLGAVVFQSPSAASALNYPTIYVMGGEALAGPLNDVWYGNINVPMSTSYTLSPTTTGQQYQFQEFLNGTMLVFKNQSNLWILYGGVVTKISDANYPAVTVPGLVVLNLFVYVMTPNRVIRSCAINDPTTWPTLQNVAASYGNDTGVYLGLYLNYVTAFGEFTTQFFYDNANPAPGIAISPYTNANLRIGCADAQTMVSMNNTLVFVGNTEQRGNTVMQLNGMSYDVLSPTWVNRVLTNNITGSTRSLSFSESGHSYYVLILSANALVYDFAMQQWYVWDNTTATVFPYTHAVTEFVTGGDIFLGNVNAAGFGGKLFTVDPTHYDDNGTQFQMAVQTDKIDAKSEVLKYWGFLDFIADTNSSASVSISWSDNDYASFTTPLTVALSGMRPRINRLGASRRRAYLITETDSQPARWEALELTYSEGES